MSPAGRTSGGPGSGRQPIQERSVFAHLKVVEGLLASPAVGLLTDLDGTLAPIQENPAAVTISPACRSSLRRLAQHLTLVAVLSGRPVEEVRKIVGVEGVLYVGNHGLQRWAQGEARTLEAAEPFRQPVQEALAALRRLSIPGVSVEDKGVVAAIHYRQARDPAAARAAIREALEALAAPRGLRMTEGKMVVEVRPPVAVDKGVVLRDLVREYALGKVLLLGDDLTDLDAFRALRQMVVQGEVRGVAVAVLGPETPEDVAREADLTLEGAPETERFLAWLVERGGLSVA